MRKAVRRNGSLQPQTIEIEIALLRDLDLKGLRTRWQNQFGRAAPEHLTRYLLFRILAYRTQAERLGDLDPETLRLLDQAARPEGPLSNISSRLVALNQRRTAPPPGTILVREWDRKSHQIMVLQDGFAWNGKTFDSLSQVAFAITGTKWNGPRFFGLRDPRPQLNAGDSE